LRRRQAFDVHSRHRAPTHWHRPTRQTDIEYAWQPAEAFSHVLEDSHQFGAAIAHRRRRYREEQHLLAVETDVDPVQLRDRASEQAGADEQEGGRTMFGSGAPSPVVMAGSPGGQSVTRAPDTGSPEPASTILPTISAVPVLGAGA